MTRTNHLYQSSIVPCISLVLAMALLACGCKSKVQMPTLLDGLTKQSPYSSPAVWEEHTVGLPFVYGYDEGIARAKAENRPAMIFLTTTWCKWCKKMSEESLRDPEIRSLLEQNFVLVLVDGDTEAAAKRKLKNQGYPHLVFVSPDEQILASQNGYAQPDKLKQVIASALGN